MALCQVFRSAKRTDTYLYTDLAEGVARVPADLLQRLGQLDPVLKVDLQPGRKLAKADADKVLAAIAERGYYLQLPSTTDQDMAIIRARNEKLPRG